MNKKIWEELEAFFKEETNTPDVFNEEIKRSALRIATCAAHPDELEATDLEAIACTLSHLSEIIDIVNKYEN